MSLYKNYFGISEDTALPDDKQTWWEKAQSEGIGNLHELCHKMKWGMPGDDVFKVVITGVAQQAETIRQMTELLILCKPFMCDCDYVPAEKCDFCIKADLLLKGK